MNTAQITITVLDSLAQIAPQDWDACACPEAADGGRPDDPFTTHRFLSALENSGSVGPGTGWQPHYLLAQHNGQVIAVAPLYAKGHSQGEYIFDHSWADAYERAGGRYYPKLQVAVPFTPVTGRRFLTRPGHEDTGRGALIEGAQMLAERNGLSSLHITYCTQGESDVGARAGLLARVNQQYCWTNAGYRSFDDFLASLSSRKRKAIRKERARAQGFGGDIRSFTGAQIQPAHWDAFWDFYQDTGARKWGTPYLRRDFFNQLQAHLRDDILLVMAFDRGRPVAGALNLIGRGALFGRYWGCREHHSALHFELCYYQAMDYAIARGLSRVEAGAQGEHKIARGYLPVFTHSLHWLREPSFHDAVAHYLKEERAAVCEDVEILTGYGPFRNKD